MMANELRAAGNTLRSSEHAPAASDLDLNIHFRPPSINNSHARSALSEQSSGGGGGGGWLMLRGILYNWDSRNARRTVLDAIKMK